MPDSVAVLAALIQARRDGDRAAEAEALTRLHDNGIRVFFGDALSPPRHSDVHETHTGRPRQASP